MPKNTYKKIITEIIKKELPEASIFLFGSRARGDNSPGSDVDIAIYNKKPINIITIAKIQDEIESANVPFFVDIVDANYTSDIMKKLIEKDKVLWKA